MLLGHWEKFGMVGVYRRETLVSGAAVTSGNVTLKQAAHDLKG